MCLESYDRSITRSRPQFFERAGEGKRIFGDGKDTNLGAASLRYYAQRNTMAVKMVLLDFWGGREQ